MSKTPSGAPQRLARRAFIVGAATLPLTAQTAATPPAEASPELRALIDRCIELKAAVSRLNEREAALRLTELEQVPAPPAALCRRKADARLFRWTDYRLRKPSIGIGEPYTRDEIKLLGDRKMMRNRDVGEIDSPDFRVVREPWPLAQARAGAIVAAQRQWDDDCATLRDRLGLSELEEALNETYQAMWDAEEEIEAFAPRSIEDVRLKATFAIDHFYCGGSAEHGSDVFAWSVLSQLAGRERLPAVG